MLKQKASIWPSGTISRYLVEDLIKQIKSTDRSGSKREEGQTPLCLHFRCEGVTCRLQVHPNCLDDYVHQLRGMMLLRMGENKAPERWRDDLVTWENYRQFIIEITQRILHIKWSCLHGDHGTACAVVIDKIYGKDAGHDLVFKKVNNTAPGCNGAK